MCFAVNRLFGDHLLQISRPSYRRPPLPEIPCAHRLKKSVASADRAKLPDYENNRVVITGIGIISPLGTSINQTWVKLITGQSYVKPLSELYNNFPCRIASQIDENVINDIKMAHLNATELKTMSRASVLLIKAASEAMMSAGITKFDKADTYKYGVSIGIGFDGVDGSVDANKFNHSNLPYSSVGPFALTKALGNMPAAHLSLRYELKGPSRSVNTACAAGLNAIGDAYRSVQAGETNLVLAGGVEAAISPWTIAAFSRIRALPTTFNDKPDAASRPFDCDRAGFIMSEGAAVLVIEELKHAIQASRKPLAEIIGFGQSCDAFSLVAPDSTSDGACRAMQAALDSSGIDPGQVNYVNAHATSTPQGDLLECQAIERVFGNRVLVSSFKGQIGHCLGASGALETALTVQCIQQGLIPPNGNLKKPDPKISVNLVPGGSNPIQWIDERKIVLKNSFGFGGTNCSLLLSSYCDEYRC